MQSDHYFFLLQVVEAVAAPVRRVLLPAVPWFPPQRPPVAAAPAGTICMRKITTIMTTPGWFLTQTTTTGVFDQKDFNPMHPFKLDVALEST